MKKITGLIGSILVLPALTGATALTVPNTFQANTPAVAAEVNQNFEAGAAAINDNDARITGLEIGTGPCPGADPADVMVRAGSLCVDKYEASIWDSASGGNPLPDGAFGCAANGSDCLSKIYARSEAGAMPSSDVTWFQAMTACASAGKRLPTNAEWQTLARGGSDAACNIAGGAKTAAGAAGADCESASGAADAVGNTWEWTADWVQGQGATPTGGNDTAGAGFNDDQMSGVRAATTQGGGQNFPGAVNRGGGFNDGAGAGAYALRADLGPAATELSLGFRCVR